MKSIMLMLLLVAGLSPFSQVSAQERTIVLGYCKDENGKAVENVSVYVRDSLLVSVTDCKPGKWARAFDGVYFIKVNHKAHGKNV